MSDAKHLLSRRDALATVGQQPGQLIFVEYVCHFPAFPWKAIVAIRTARNSLLRNSEYRDGGIPSLDFGKILIADDVAVAGSDRDILLFVS